MRLRLILSFALVVLVTVVSVALFARQGAAQEVHAFMLRGGMVEAQELVTSLEDYYRQTGSWQGVETLLTGPGSGWRRGPGGGMGMHGMMMSQRLRVAAADGVLVFDSAAEAPAGALTRAEIEAATPLRSDRQTVGYLLAEGGMAFNSADEAFLLNRITRAALIAGAVATTVALLLAVLLTDRLLRPVRALTAAARRLGQGDLAQRVNAVGNDELAVLGRAFNRMAASLQDSEARRRALTADIAHELRTPLAVQRAHLEALQDGIYLLNPENLRPVLDQNAALTRLVDDLRTLALAEAGQLKLERTPTDLPALATRVVERFQPQAVSRGIDLRLEPALGEPPGSFLLDPGRIEQILANLLTNALRHTPEGGQVRVQVSRALDTAQLRVRDSGPGIPEEALPHIFERFYRADRARSRAEGGAGLGLAIARQLAEAHGGTLTAANHPQGGAELTLSLPGSA